MVVDKMTRSQILSSERFATWLETLRIPERATQVFKHYQKVLADALPIRKASHGELAIQETMSAFLLFLEQRTWITINPAPPAPSS